MVGVELRIQMIGVESTEGRSRVHHTAYFILLCRLLEIQVGL